MATYEDLFSSCNLEVVVPQASLDLPDLGGDVDEWYRELTVNSLERNTAFFDERLESVLVLRCNHPGSDQPAEPAHPPIQLLAFLSYLQVTLEASYISSMSASPIPSAAPQLSAPPRTASLNRLKPRPPNLHPSIFPPQTPHPTPYTGDADRRYVRAEGTPLATIVWGEDMSNETRETFSLCWSADDQVWVAMYRLAVGVAFLRIHFLDPLLCLTVSVTLRDKPADPSPARRTLESLIMEAGGLPLAQPRTPRPASGEVDQDEADFTGLAEVNLLEGLSLGPTFGSSEESRVYLPSSRLGVTTRRNAFALSFPAFSSTLAPSPLPITQKANQTMRKSFRKTLATASGFRVRMRTVFAPYVLLPDAGALGGAPPDELERREAGAAENTVVLSVEVENTGEAHAGFAVERVDVSVGGEGARAALVGWGAEGLRDPSTVFPVRIAPYEQYNLLYAVSFQRSPDADDFAAGGLAQGDLQRAVTINIHGRPYEIPITDDEDEDGLPEDAYTYPTRTFASRWNCVLDLSPKRNRDSRQLFQDDPYTGREALPEPASPFPSGLSPGPTAMTGTFALAQQHAQRAAQAVAGSRRHTAAHITTPHFVASPSPISSAGRGTPAPTNYRGPASALNPAVAREHELEASFSRRPGGSALPPSLALQQGQTRRATTTYAPPSSPPLPAVPGASARDSAFFDTPHVRTGAGAGGMPQTPAYPAYPSTPGPPTPRAQPPVTSQHAGAVGPRVEIRRERGMGGGLGGGAGGTLVPPTPGPRVPTAPAGELGSSNYGVPLNMAGVEVGVDAMTPEEGEGVVVSIGLLADRREDRRNEDGEDDDEKAAAKTDEGLGRIYPLDRFTLDVFVFNQSSWTRRFEVSYPDRRRRKRERARAERQSGYFGEGPGGAVVEKRTESAPGVVPLENKVRVGPLRPSTCQSVRMDFLAVAPGVHAIDALTLTDIETGYAVTLRSVMDVVVHEPWDR